jgi:hypothetical protein
VDPVQTSFVTLARPGFGGLLPIGFEARLLPVSQIAREYVAAQAAVLELGIRKAREIIVGTCRSFCSAVRCRLRINVSAMPATFFQPLK